MVPHEDETEVSSANVETDKRVAEILYEVGALVGGLDSNDKKTPLFLEAYANVVISFINQGYAEAVEDTADDILTKAKECGASVMKREWCKQLRRKLGMFAEDSDSPVKNSRDDDDDDEDVS